jgi:hypothetical protein
LRGRENPRKLSRRSLKQKSREQKRMKRMLQPMEGVVMMMMTTAARRRRAMKKREREMKDIEMRREERNNWEGGMIRWIKTSATCGT